MESGQSSQEDQARPSGHRSFTVAAVVTETLHCMTALANRVLHVGQSPIDSSSLADALFQGSQKEKNFIKFKRIIANKNFFFF